MKKKSIQFYETTLSYQIWGDGAAIVLLHGFAEDHTVWHKQIEYLSEDYKVITIDLFGTGNSKHLNKPVVEIADYAAAIKQIVDEEQIEKCILLGHSMGGYIALSYCDQYPNDLLGLGLIHSTIFNDDASKIMMRKKSIQFIQAHGAAAFLKTSVPDLFYDVEKSKEYIDAIIKKGSNISPATLVQYYEAMMRREDYTKQLASWNIPYLFICGKHDKAVPYHHSLKQITIGATVWFTILKNSAHMGFLEEPELTQKEISAFIHYCLSK